MHFDLTDDQKLLVETVQSFIKKRSPLSRARAARDSDIGFDRGIWREMGELGWLGIPYPESVGGFGGQFLDAALVLEQFGRALVPEPYLASVLLGGNALVRGGSDAQIEEWVAPMMAGERTLALALFDRNCRYAVEWMSARGEKRGSGYELSGEKSWVLGGAGASGFVVAARTSGSAWERGGLSLFIVDPEDKGVRVTPVSTIDGRRAARLELSGVLLGAERLVGAEGEAAPLIDKLFDTGAAAVAAEAVGVASTSLSMTVEYLQTREQFGVPIGSFQALQHRAVDMFTATELLRSAALESSIRMSADDDAMARGAVSSAKYQLSTAGRYVVAQAVQLHGGIGCTDEHDIGLFFKRMQVLATLFGDEEFHVTRYHRQQEFEAA